VSQTKKLKPSSFKEGDLCVEPLPMVVWLVGPSTRLGNNVTYSYPHDRKKAAYHAAPSLSHRSLCQCRHSKCSMSCQCRQSNFCRISLQQVLLLIRVFSKCLGPFTSRLTSFDLYHVSELCFSSVSEWLDTPFSMSSCYVTFTSSYGASLSSSCITVLKENNC